MKNFVKIAGVGLLALLCIGGLFYSRLQPKDVLTSTSPNGKIQIVIRERARHIDRNFRVVLVDLTTKAETTLYTSDDQSPTNSSEQFVWSADSTKVALTGDRYYVVPLSETPNGDLLFLLIDLKTLKIWSNEDSISGLPRINAQQASQILGTTNF